MIVVVIGVAGSGKTTVGRALADHLGCAFYDADDYHPAANIAAMTAGVALTDAEREPWLARLRELLLRLQSEKRDAVLACSALRRSFRDRLREGLRDVRYVYLEADRELIRNRVAGRKDHFMPAELIDSQFAALEEPADALTFDAGEPVDDLVARIMASLR